MYIEKSISENKAYEIQIELNEISKPYFIFDFNIEFNKNELMFKLDLFGIVHIEISLKRKCDHAGLSFSLFTFFSAICFSIYDKRHYDYAEDKNDEE